VSGLLIRKYGGSVLVGLGAVVRVAEHVRDAVRGGRRVIAVVSALRGETDALAREGRAVAREPDPAALDLLLSTGETRSAALLALALRDLGVRASAVNPLQAGLVTDGAHGEGTLLGVNPLPIRAALAGAEALVVPGFVGRAAGDHLTTLGRGGSDLTAVALAGALGAEACGFVKDVPGYFTADPNESPDAEHLPLLDVEEARAFAAAGCGLLQDRALDLAAELGVPLLIESLDDPRSTRIEMRFTGGAPACPIPGDGG
jgi:aspartate kinase